MRSQYEITVGGRLGPGVTDDKEASVLNRIVRWTDGGIEYEADPRQIEKRLDELDLTETRDVSRPDIALRARINLNDP